MKRTAIRIVCLWIGLSLLFTLLMIAVCSIPKSAVWDNIKASGKIFQKESAYPNPFHNYFSIVDNYTDLLMIDGIMLEDEAHPVAGAMLNVVVFNTNQIDFEDILDEYTSDREDKRLWGYEYGRYWHGYEVVLKPMLCFFSLRGIRIANTFFFFLLAAVVAFLLYSRVGRWASFSFLLCLFLGNIVVVPKSLQYSSMFIVSMISMIVLLLNHRLTETISDVFVSFFIIGSFAVFIDYLTTPQLTLCLPLVAILLAYPKTKPNRHVFFAMSGWGLGYSLLWVTKWLLATLLTDKNMIKDALVHAEERSSNVYDGESWTLHLMLSNTLSFFTTNPIFIVLGILLLGGLIYCIMSSRIRGYIKQNSWMLLVFAFVPLWYFVLRNHTVEHFFFTWRALLAPIWILLLFILPQTKNNRPR